MAITENLVAFAIDFFFDQSFEKWWNRPTFWYRVTDIFGNQLEIWVELFDCLSNVDDFTDAVFHQFHIVVLHLVAHFWECLRIAAIVTGMCGQQKVII